MSQPQSRYYQSQRLKLHYVVWGHEGKPPLMLIRGGPDHCRNWDAVAPALSGMYNLPEFVLDIATLVANLGDGPLTIIGHSLGGAIALQYAGTFPERVTNVVAIEGLGPRIIEH